MGELAEHVGADDEPGVAPVLIGHREHAQPVLAHQVGGVEHVRVEADRDGLASDERAQRGRVLGVRLECGLGHDRVQPARGVEHRQMRDAGFGERHQRLTDRVSRRERV